jgi:hypothetical protein
MNMGRAMPRRKRKSLDAMTADEIIAFRQGFRAGLDAATEAVKSAVKSLAARPAGDQRRRS